MQDLIDMSCCSFLSLSLCVVGQDKVMLFDIHECLTSCLCQSHASENVSAFIFSEGFIAYRTKPLVES